MYPIRGSPKACSTQMRRACLEPGSSVGLSQALTLYSRIVRVEQRHPGQEAFNNTPQHLYLGGVGSNSGPHKY